MGEEIGEQQDFDNRDTHNSKWCLAYGRDRGESDVEAETSETLSDMIWQEYHYVWDNGKWHCYGGDGRELVF